jgi:secreted trypsin-like serine protease
MKPFDVLSQGKIVRKYIQLGIISFNECGQEGLPTVYTNILYYMPWILDHL